MSAEVEGGFTVYCIPCRWEESGLDDLTEAEELAAEHDETCPAIRDEFQKALDVALLTAVDSRHNQTKGV